MDLVMFIIICVVGISALLIVSDIIRIKIQDKSRLKKYEKWVKNNDDKLERYAKAVIKLFIEEGKPANPVYMTMKDNLEYIRKYYDAYVLQIKASILVELRHCFVNGILTDGDMSFEDTFNMGRILDYQRCAYDLDNAITEDYDTDMNEKAENERKEREMKEKERTDRKLFELMG